jgi:hypothetical protein
VAEFEQHKAIKILFDYITDYEAGGKFDSNEFRNYFENVMAHLKLVRDQNKLDIVKGVDDTLLGEFDKVPFTTPRGNTDIRYFSAHLLATAFPIIIPMAAQFQQAYRFSAKLRQNKADIDFLELELTPYLLDRTMLKRSPELRYFFLTKISEIQNLNHDPNILEEAAYQNLDRLESVPPPRLFLALRRRNLGFSADDVLEDRQSPEYKLSEYKIFSKMSDSNPIYHDILLEMGYLKTKIPFVGQVKQFFSAVFAFLGGILKAPRYVFFEFTKSRFNFVFYIASLIIAIVVLFGAIRLMGAYNQKKLINFQRKIEEARNQ